MQYNTTIITLAFSSLLCISLCYSVMAADDSVSSAFDNIVSTSSTVTNMMDVALESSLRSTLVGADGSVPGEVHYSFSISGLNNSAEKGAIGFARTEFAVTTLEGRSTGSNVSSERMWKDITEVSGTIINFRKNFDYTSSLRI